MQTYPSPGIRYHVHFQTCNSFPEKVTASVVNSQNSLKMEEASPPKPRHLQAHKTSYPTRRDFSHVVKFTEDERYHRHGKADHSLPSNIGFKNL
jgi:hypothetical protein